MAEKQAVFTLKVDTGNSVQDVQNFDHAVQSLNKDLKQTQATASQQTGLDGFESKLQELDQKLKAGGLSMREMNKLMKEYQTVALQAGSASPIGDRATQSAAALKDQIVDLDTRVRLLSSDTIKLDTAMAGVATGAAAFQGITSAVALTGVESEALVKTMVKLQAAQGLVNSVNIIAQNLNKDAILGIQIRNTLQKAQNFILYGSAAAVTAESTATKAGSWSKGCHDSSHNRNKYCFKIIQRSIACHRIGAIVVGLGLLIANFDKIVKAIQPVIDQFKKMADFIGLTDFAGEEAAKNEKARLEKLQAAYEQKIKEQQKYAENLKKAYQLDKEFTESQINLLESQGKSTIALRKEQALLEVQNAKKLLQQKEEAANVLGLNDAYAQRLGINKKLTQAEQDITAAKTTLNTAESNLNKVNQEAGKIADDNFKKAQARRKAILDNLQKQFNDELKLQDELEKAKLALISDARKKELATAQESFDDYREKFLIERTKDEKAALDKQFINGKISREKYNAELLDLQKNAANKLTDTEREIIIAQRTKTLARCGCNK
jgi:hypothetical protein